MAARKMVVAVLALMLVLPAGGAAAADRFKYRYEVAEVDLWGRFWSNYDDGLGHTMAAYEQIWVRATGPRADREARTGCLIRDNRCDVFLKSRFTLRNPAAQRFAPNGTLTTQSFKRYYEIDATETRPDQPPVDCSRDVEDEDKFGASMWLTGRKVKAFWTLPAVAVRCDLKGGQISADPIDRTARDPQKQFTVRYPLRMFRRHRRVVMNVEIDHDWQEGSFTANRIRWTGWVIAKRVR